MKPRKWAERWDQLRRYLSQGLWVQELEPSTWTTRGVRVLQFGFMLGEGFVRDSLLLRASALTYFTLLSIVPLLAIVSAVATALGVTENVVGIGLDQIRGAFPEVAAKVEEFLANANIGALGSLGAGALLLTTLLGISNIERAVNHIWGVKQQRSWARRFPDYLAVLIVGPMLLGASLSLATTVKSQWVIEKLTQIPGFAGAFDLGLSQLPTVVLVGAFSFLYWFLPNTNVRAFSALLGGVFTALAVNAALAAYVGLSVGFARADVLYGGFAQFPLFFVWIYFFWAIVLFGAEIAFAYQNLDLYVREVRGERAGPAEREAIGMRIALEIARAFRDGAEPWTDDALSVAMQVPVRTVRDVLVPLENARIVTAIAAEERAAGWQLRRPADAIRATDVLAALRGDREPVSGDADVTRVVESLLAELAEGERKAADGATLEHLLAAVPLRRRD